MRNRIEKEDDKLNKITIETQCILSLVTSIIVVVLGSFGPRPTRSFFLFASTCFLCCRFWWLHCHFQHYFSYIVVVSDVCFLLNYYIYSHLSFQNLDLPVQHRINGHQVNILLQSQIFDWFMFNQSLAVKIFHVYQRSNKYQL